MRVMAATAKPLAWGTGGLCLAMRPAHVALWLKGGSPIATVSAAVTDSVTFSER